MKSDVKPGDVFNRLTIIKEVDKHVYPSGETRRKFLAQCSCGSEPKAYLFNQLTSGKTKSCGCLNTENITKHGMHKSRVYQCWADMKDRCDNPNNKYFHHYGGRGITYCEEWKDFINFWNDMKNTYSDDLTINRIDNDKGYFKENCEWTTKNVQGHSKRKLEGTILKSIGVFIDKKTFVYSVRMKINKNAVTFGTYKTEEEAAKAYDDASQMFYGDRPTKTEYNEDWILEKVKKYMEKRGLDLRVHKVV